MRNLVLSICISYRDKVTRKTKEVGVKQFLAAMFLFISFGLQQSAGSLEICAE